MFLVGELGSMSVLAWIIAVSAFILGAIICGLATYFLFHYTKSEFTKVDMKSEEKYRLRVYAYS